jgi:hypothetical protein
VTAMVAWGKYFTVYACDFVFLVVPRVVHYCVDARTRYGLPWFECVSNVDIGHV